MTASRVLLVGSVLLAGSSSAATAANDLTRFARPAIGRAPTGFPATTEANDRLPPSAASRGESGLRHSLPDALSKGFFTAYPFLAAPGALTCGSDQTANAQAAIAAAGPGKSIFWPAGCIAISGTLTQQPGQRWFGAGGIGTTTGTSFSFNDGSGGGLAIRMVGSGAALEGISVINAGAASIAQTSSTAIVLSTGDNPTWQQLRDVYVQDWFNGIDVESGYFWRMDHIWVRNALNYGVLVRNTNYCDNGDSMIGDLVVQNGTTTIAGSAGLRYESGGGLKIIGSKFLGSAYGVDVQLAPNCGTTPGTGDLIVTGNSLENQTSIGIRLGLNTSGGNNTKTFGSTNITANEFYAQSSAIQTQSGIYNVNITSNLFVKPNLAVDVEGGDAIGIFANNFYKSNTAGVYLAGGVGSTNVTVGPNQYASAGSGKATVIDGRGVTDATGPVDYSDQRALTLTDSIPKMNLWQLDEAAYRSARVEVVIEGLIQNVGYVYHSRIFILVHDGKGVLAPTVISDTEIGTKVKINADNATHAGSLLVGAALDRSAGGHAANLTMTVRVIGHLAGFRPL